MHVKWFASSQKPIRDEISENKIRKFNTLSSKNRTRLIVSKKWIWNQLIRMTYDWLQSVKYLAPIKSGPTLIMQLLLAYSISSQ